MSLKQTVKEIEEAGFSYIKVELEAQLRRPYDSEDGEYQTCEDCDGEGSHACEDCDSEGYIEVELTRPDGSTSDVTEEITCDECSGSGNHECSECEGSGEVYRESSGDDFGSVEHCQEFIESHISPEAKAAIIYGRFYNDGSVDSEYTFTIHAKDAHFLPEIVDSFNALAKEVGNGMDVDGAGMHIAVLPTESNGTYPVRNFALDDTKLTNFRTEVTKLLPALFIAATSGNFTRALNYRHPKIDFDKYSAIHIVDGRCLEFRLFETCYQRPEAIFEYLETIARTLEYYKDPTKKVEAMGKEFVFYDREGIRGFTATPDQVRIIKKQLKMVVGKGVTLKSFTKTRELDLSVQSRNKDFSKKLARAKALYQDAKRDYEYRVSQPMSERERRAYRENQDYGYFNSEWNEEQKIAYIKGLSEVGTEEQFVNRNVLSMRLAASVSC